MAVAVAEVVLEADAVDDAVNERAGEAEMTAVAVGSAEIVTVELANALTAAEGDAEEVNAGDAVGDGTGAMMTRPFPPAWPACPPAATPVA